jgi:hypothetical protein
MPIKLDKRFIHPLVFGYAGSTSAEKTPTRRGALGLTLFEMAA